MLAALMIYFVSHLTNLTRIPIFNDEAIYLDWAWINTRLPGHLFDSLFDSKQPLLFWIWGIFERIFADPLFAGRLVAVFFGALTLSGVYTLARKLSGQNTALLAAGLYTVIPIFVFYNRLALMEAAVAAVGIWGGYFLLKLMDRPNLVNGFKLGAVMAWGFLIKSSSLLFLISNLFVILFLILIKKQRNLVLPAGMLLAGFLFLCGWQLMHPLFWKTIATNSRYAFLPGEILILPFSVWIKNLMEFLRIGWLFLTPLVFLGGLIGLKKIPLGLRLYFLLALFLEMLLVKSQSQRYLLPFLPFLAISAATVLVKQRWLALAAGLLPFGLSAAIIFAPEHSLYAQSEFFLGQTSGIGVLEVIGYIKEQSRSDQPTLVFFAFNAGNPENAVDLYTLADKQLFGLHLDSALFPDLQQFDCLVSRYPAFFVTRVDQLAGMERYFIRVKTFANPDGNYYLGLYQLRPDCRGKTLVLSDYYEKTLSRLSSID